MIRKSHPRSAVDPFLGGGLISLLTPFFDPSGYDTDFFRFFFACISCRFVKKNVIFPALLPGSENGSPFSLGFSASVLLLFFFSFSAVYVVAPFFRFTWFRLLRALV